MKTVRLVIEVEYDDEIMYDNDEDAKDWFFNSVLNTGDLILHSNEIGDKVGTVRVLECSEL